MRDASLDQVSDLIEVDLGPGARGYFTTRGLRGTSPLGGDNGDARAWNLDGREASVFEGWNLALHVGDDPQRVHRHRRRLEDLLELDRDQHLAWMNQVHSSVVAAARAEQVPTADALVLPPDAASSWPTACRSSCPPETAAWWRLSMPGVEACLTASSPQRSTPCRAPGWILLTSGPPSGRRSAAPATRSPMTCARCPRSANRPAPHERHGAPPALMSRQASWRSSSALESDISARAIGVPTRTRASTPFDGTERPGDWPASWSRDDVQTTEYFLGVTFLKPEVGDTPG